MQLKDFYQNKDNLSNEDKILYAKATKRMMIYCDGAYTPKEKLKEIVNNLSIQEKDEIERQIKMYKQGREYYRLI